jgi:hypothetical protein
MTKRSVLPLAPMQFPLRFRDPHQQLLVLDRDPAREDLHRVLEIAIEEDLPGAIDQRRTRGMEDIETSRKRARFTWRAGEVRVAEEHEDIPHPELGGEGNRVVEQSQIPPGAVRSGLDIELRLRKC